jgi:protein-S-isoprenylcysteine O-methyltransferase Ste14
MSDREHLEAPAPESGAPPRWDLRGAIRAIGHPSITRMILFIYLPLLIPSAVIAGLISRWADGKIRAWLDSKFLVFSWPELPGFPLNVWIWLALTVVGLTIVWWCYSYLVIVGGGGPAPLVAKGAVRVVIGGPYALNRHPSVWGKALGVIGLGFLLRSPLFTFVLIPLALTVSLVEKKYFMEQRDLRHFGPKYAEYIRRVPFFVPRWSDILRSIRVLRGLEDEVSVLDDLEIQQDQGAPTDDDK